MARKICLAYSGGLDTSIIIPWLREKHPGAQVVAYCADVGQGDSELEGLEEKGLASGACEVVVDDLRRRMLEDVVFPALRAGAVYERVYLLGTALARPVIARGQVETALREGCDALCHGCTGKGNDQVRFEHAFQALAPQLEVIVPWREWDIRSREDALDYAAEHGVPVRQTKEKLYSRDANLWHISHEGGVLEDPAQAAPEDVWQWTLDPRRAPDRGERLSLQFQHGTPVGIDGEEVDCVELMDVLNARGAAHGVGRIDLVENRLVGIKSRGAYETPGGAILVQALRALEELCLDRASMRLKDSLSTQYADLIYDGLYFSPARVSLDALFSKLMEPVSGSVQIELWKGSSHVLGRSSQNSLYRERLATFGAGEGYDQKDAGGFVRLHGLGAAIAWQRERSGGKEGRSSSAHGSSAGAGSPR